MSDWMDAESHADRALELYERGRLAEAESELRKAIALNPDQSEWHFNLGLTLEAGGRDLEALGSFTRAAELSPEDLEPALAAAMACNRLGRFEAALVWADRALAVRPASDVAAAEKIEALTALGQHDEAEAAFYMVQQLEEEPSARCLAAIAESLIVRAEYGRAAWCLREVLRLEPQMPRARARLALVLSRTGQPQRAIQFYLRELRDDPGSVQTLLDYGRLLLELARHGEAEEKFRRVLELEPANVDAHEQLGEAALSAGRLEQARLEFELAVKLDPELVGTRVRLARVLVQRGAPEAARRWLLEELERVRLEAEEGRLRSVEALEELGGLLLDCDRPDLAAEVLGLIDDEAADRPSVLRKLAAARFRAGDVGGGCWAARRVLRHEPGCVASIHNLALAALESGQLAVAGGWIRRGLRADRHDIGLRRLRVRHAVATVVAWMARIPMPWRGRSAS